MTPLNSTQKQLTYRPGGWNIAQVVHHCSDSHMNSLIRFKWALTEDNPLIKAYFEDRWSELHDYSSTDLKDSLLLLKGVHRKLTHLIRGLNSTQLNRSFIHPETNESISLIENIGKYAWHCNHHLAHIKNALTAK